MEEDDKEGEELLAKKGYCWCTTPSATSAMRLGQKWAPERATRDFRRPWSPEISRVPTRLRMPRTPTNTMRGSTPTSTPNGRRYRGRRRCVAASATCWSGSRPRYQTANPIRNTDSRACVQHSRGPYSQRRRCPLPHTLKAYAENHNPLTRLMCYADLDTQSSQTLAAVLLVGRALPKTMSELSRRGGPPTATPSRVLAKIAAESNGRCGHNFPSPPLQSSRANQPSQRSASTPRRAFGDESPSTAMDGCWIDSICHITSSSGASPNVACGQRLGCLTICVVLSVFREAPDVLRL